MYEFFQSLGQRVVDGITSIAHWFGQLFTGIWEGFKQFLALIFRPLLLFFQGLWYLLEKCFDIVVLVIQVIFGLFKVFGSIVLGVLSTFSQLLGFSGRTDYYHLPQAYQGGWEGVFNFLNTTGINTIALIMAVFVWLLTAYAVIKVAGGER